MTTANGDGLEFNPYLGSIFDEIERIKESLNEGETFVKRKNSFDEEIKMEDIPEHLKPTSIIIEVVNALEELKVKMKEVSDKEEEITNVI